ncbi:serine hydrolase domain-containing protein [Amycolatopsis nigrescens]|uniref:serine hydrolase domain-containing protein n=1 Tax=Amycolatopsis nigrescens TaxID=381445 RepID=UPI0003AA3BC1|nr:serine hydrolase domain-containing protein [Amycolatopsis nigrescens]
MHRTKLLPVAVVAGLLSLTAPAAVAAPSPSALDPALLNRMLDELKAAGAPAVLAEARAGKEVWSAARGNREPGRADPARPTDRVRIASLTKSMVSTVTLQLTGEGRLGLDDPIERYLPGLLPYEETITIRQLLGHTSGLTDYIREDIYPSIDKGSAEDVRNNRYREFTPEQIVGMVAARPLLFKPGKGFSYSNANYVLIGMLIEKLTGHSVESELEHRIFRPVGMRASYLPRWSPHIRGAHPRGNYATGDPAEPLLDTSDLSPTQFWSAAAVISTPGDVNKFYRAMLDGTLLPPPLLAEAKKFSTNWAGMYGLGLLGMPTPSSCTSVPGGVAYGHTGGGLGYTTYAFSSADGSRQVAFTYTLDSTLDTAMADRLGEAGTRLGLAAMCST